MANDESGRVAGAFEPLTLAEIEEMRERVDFEAKRAGGADGKGELPAAFFPSYVAMANTTGGLILLGALEKNDRLKVTGIADVPRLLKQLWDSLNNPQQVSLNLLSDRDIEDREIEGKHVILVHVPRATRQQRPVHTGDNAFKGTYLRNGEGDYLVRDAEVVRRMMAERVEDSRDRRVLPNYGIDDLDIETLHRYRNHFKAEKPDHVWNGVDDREFLRLVGGWAVDREGGKGGLTGAGLLMFGQHIAITEAFPYYMVDYQERPDPSADARWIDRLVPDGTWSGNLFDFFERVIPRLTRDLKVPFRLVGNRRVDQTPVHEALREALVNTLIHADYTGRVSVLVVKRPDMFTFRNPGGLRIPLDRALKGGDNDCRNRTLQTMFRLVGLGEQAGSGLPKIYSAWRAQEWRAPDIEERTDPPEQTTVQLRTVSLLPKEEVEALEERHGTAFSQLPELAKLVMVTVELEGHVTHERLREMTGAHSRDVTLALASLLNKGLVESTGSHRLKQYFFPGRPPTARIDAGAGAPPSSTLSTASSTHSTGNRGELGADRGELDSNRGELDPSNGPPEAASLPVDLQRAIADLGGKPRRDRVQAVILRLCGLRPMKAAELAAFIGVSDVKKLVERHLAPMCADARLARTHPETPNHPDQAYRAAQTTQPGAP